MVPIATYDQAQASTVRESGSFLVKTFGLQGLADLVRQFPSIRLEVVDLLREAGEAGTPAMRARSRNLLAKLERDT